MRYRTPGTTGIPVSALALGTMNVGRIGQTTRDDVVLDPSLRRRR